MWSVTLTWIALAVGLICSVCEGVQLISRDIITSHAKNPLAVMMPQTSLQYQFYVLSHQWPQSTCQMHRDKHPPRRCDIHANVTDWGVHGLWPSDYDRQDPQFCGGGRPFNVQHLAPLLPRLLQRWPNVFAEQTAAEFWRHEWLKHGTCVQAAGAVTSQLGYFSRALDVASRLPLTAALSAAGISPHATRAVNVSSVAAAVATHVQRRVVIVCQHDMQRDQYLLAEVRVCYDDWWHLADCYHEDQQPYQLHGCNQQMVYYLPIEHTTT